MTQIPGGPKRGYARRIENEEPRNKSVGDWLLLFLGSSFSIRPVEGNTNRPASGRRVLSGSAVADFICA